MWASWAAQRGMEPKTSKMVTKNPEPVKNNAETAENPKNVAGSEAAENPETAENPEFKRPEFRSGRKTQSGRKLRFDFNLILILVIPISDLFQFRFTVVGFRLHRFRFSDFLN